MAKPDKLKKKIKQLERKLDQQTAQAEKTKKKIKVLNREVKARDQAIADLQRQLSGRQDADSEPTGALLLPGADKKLAVEHKNAWKRHKFLCERYDVHLDAGHEKDSARGMANQDLLQRYGKKAGFTPEQLCDILS